MEAESAAEQSAIELREELGLERIDEEWADTPFISTDFIPRCRATATAASAFARLWRPAIRDGTAGRPRPAPGAGAGLAPTANLARLVLTAQQKPLHLALADLDLMVGVDTQVVHGIVHCGASGAITGVGNALPREILHLVGLCERAAVGDHEA